MIRTDERIEKAKQLIVSRAFAICYFSLWGIIAFRQFVLNQSIREYGDIFILTVVVSFYVAYKNVIQGILRSFDDKSKKSKHVSIFIEMLYYVFFILTFSFITGIQGYEKLGVVFLIVIGVRGSVKLLLYISDKIADRDIEE